MTRVVHIGAQPVCVDALLFTRDLMFVHALHEDGAIRLVPLRMLTDFVDLEIRDTAANAQIRDCSRGLRRETCGEGCRRDAS